MAKKYYAVKKGRRTGIFMTWDECKAQVDGFNGAAYKGFSTRGEAEQFLGGEPNNSKAAKEKAEEMDIIPYKENAAIAYTDGSYKADTHEFSCGAVLFYNWERMNFSKKYRDPEMADMRNVAGEIMGAVSVINYCTENKIPELEIRYDYEGVEKWATGEWKANKTGTKAYAALCSSVKDKIKLSFTHIKGHSGDTYNDEADMLAKKALGIK